MSETSETTTPETLEDALAEAYEALAKARQYAADCLETEVTCELTARQNNAINKLAKFGHKHFGRYAKPAARAAAVGVRADTGTKLAAACELLGKANSDLWDAYEDLGHTFSNEID